jgi:hypothetical protein
MVEGGTRETLRQDLERFWDDKLQRARERYLKAAAEFHRHVLERGVEQAEAAYAGTGVHRAEAEAFADYCRVLAAFTELVAVGVIPKPEQTLR